MSGNHFVWQGRDINCNRMLNGMRAVSGDRWLGQWRCVSRNDDSLCLVYEHRSGVYHYGKSGISLTADTLTVTLSVTDQGAETLPFGTGWPPYFPLSPQTRIRRRRAVTGWNRSSGWRVVFEQLPQELDFNHWRRARASG
ncbi:hypothetical protein ACNKHP_06085 [Shigella boydii]